MKPEYFEAGLFETSVPHRITVIKAGNELYMQIRNDTRTVLWRWENTSHPIPEGRIGLRHMDTRGARYRDFRVYKLESSE